MTDVTVTVPEVLGESLSPSQVSTYMTCPDKWYFRYLIGLSEPTTGVLALGKAFHGTLARNFSQKLSTMPRTSRGSAGSAKPLPRNFKNSLARKAAVLS